MLLPSGSRARLDQSRQLAMAPAWTLFLTPGIKSQAPIPSWESGNRSGCLQAAASGLAHKACVNPSWVFKSALGSPTSTQPLQPPAPPKSRLGTPNNHGLPNPPLPFPKVICRAEEPAPAFCLEGKSRRRKDTGRSITCKRGFTWVDL